MKKEKNKISKLASVLIALQLVACGGGGTSDEMRSDGSHDKVGLPSTFVELPKTYKEESCEQNVIDINNNSEVLMICGAARNAVIWSQSSGFTELSTYDRHIGYLAPKMLSDNGKVLFQLVPNDIHELSGKMFLYDTGRYSELENVYHAVMSKSGEYVAGISAEGVPVLLRGREKVSLATLTGDAVSYDIQNVNDQGVTVGSVQFGDSANTFANNFGFVVSESEAKLLTPFNRPDINSSAAIDINNAQEVLFTEEILSSESESIFSVAILKGDSVTDISMGSDSASPIAISNSGKALVAIGDFQNYNRAIVYTPGKGIELLTESIGVSSDVVINSTLNRINNKNEVILTVRAGGSEHTGIFLLQ